MENNTNVAITTYNARRKLVTIISPKYRGVSTVTTYKGLSKPQARRYCLDRGINPTF